MLVFQKGKSGVSYTLLEKESLSLQKAPNDILIFPNKRLTISTFKRNMSFEDWQKKYQKQIQDIIFVFESQVANLTYPDHNVFLNISKFREMLIRKLYETSSNRLKQA